MASEGSSSVANWLGRSDAGMKWPERRAMRGSMVAASPFKYTIRTLPPAERRSRYEAFSAEQATTAFSPAALERRISATMRSNQGHRSSSVSGSETSGPGAGA